MPGRCLQHLLLRAHGSLLDAARVSCSSNLTQSAVGTRAFHASAVSREPQPTEALLSPQPGGYFRTGGVSSSTDRLLITGASGQVGSELIPHLRQKLGAINVIASDVKLNRQLLDYGPFVYCDVTDKDNLARIILENDISVVVHLATLLSAIGERNPALALRVNTQGIQNVLELASLHNLRVFSPSTIAVFGPSTPRHATPDDTVMRPTTMYGVTKVHQELLGDYYCSKFGVDYRSLRYPGVISYNSMPGGGTTDYAVDIFHAALNGHKYECFLDTNTELPFMYMPDCLNASYGLMTAPNEQLNQRTYNVTAMSFSPLQLAEAIRAEVPSFEVVFHPDFRDNIARTWPTSIDDSRARQDWGWQHEYSLKAMTRDMLDKLADKLAKTASGAQRGRQHTPASSTSASDAVNSSSKTAKFDEAAGMAPALGVCEVVGS